VVIKVVETGREVPAEPLDPSTFPEGFQGDAISLPGTEFKQVRETVEAGTSQPATAANRAGAESPQQVQPGQPSAGQKPNTLPEKPADPTPGLRGVSEPQRSTDTADAIDKAIEQEPPQAEATQPQTALQEDPDPSYLRSRRPRAMGPARDDDPHERERKRLDEELGRYHEMTPKEKHELEWRLGIWQWRDKEKYPDETPVIGPHGHMGRDAYEKTKKRVEAQQKLADQLELGRAIAEGNPLSSAVALKIYDETGDPIAAAQGGDAVAGITGGGKGGKGRRPQRARRVQQRRTQAKRKTARSNGRRDNGRKGAPKGKKVRGHTPTIPRRKLTRRQRHYQREVQRLIEQLHPEQRKRVTVAILIVEKGGRREVWISTSLEKAPSQIEKAARRGHVVLRGSKSDPGNKDRPRGEKLTHHHAEHDGISIAKSNGYKVLEVYPSRKACGQCSKFRDLGYTVIDPE
jgi:hypothetical protein